MKYKNEIYLLLKRDLFVVLCHYTWVCDT